MAGLKGVAFFVALFVALTAGLAPGEIVRSKKVVREFKRITGFPHGRPGYVVDHMVPLACGGLDEPINLQWSTVAEAKAKDKWEKKCCPEWSSFTFR